MIILSSLLCINIVLVIIVSAIVAGFSSLPTVALIETVGTLGDVGSLASDSTLFPISGLNADENHNHIYDTCVPTFLHFWLDCVTRFIKIFLNKQKRDYHHIDFSPFIFVVIFSLVWTIKHSIIDF